MAFGLGGHRAGRHDRRRRQRLRGRGQAPALRARRHRPAGGPVGDRGDRRRRRADPELVAADLLGQAEHGPTSPAVLVTTSEELGRAVRAEVERQLEELATAEVAGAAWRDHGAIVVAPDRETAAFVCDELAPEHLEVQTADDGWYHDRLRNYGSIFLGARATVAYSDKGATGTNHVLPTAHAARYTGGLVGRAVPEAADLPADRERRGGDGDRGGGRRDLGRRGSGRARRHGGQAAGARLKGRGTMHRTSHRRWRRAGARRGRVRVGRRRGRSGRRRRAARRRRGAHDLLEPAAAGRGAGAVGGGGQRRQARARAGGRQGGQVPGQVRLARRLDRAGGGLGAERDVRQRAQGGAATSRRSATSASSTRARPRSRCRSSTRRGIAQVSPGNTAVGITSDDPGATPGRARQVLPDRRAHLRPRAAQGHLPGRRAGGAGQGEGLRLGLHPQRQGGLRRGPGQERRARRQEGRPGDQGQRGHRQERRQLPLARVQDQGDRRAVLHLQRDHGQQRGPDLQGHRRRAARRAAARPRGRRRVRLLRPQGRRPARRRRQARADHDPRRRARGVPARRQGVPRRPTRPSSARRTRTATPSTATSR